MNECGITAVQFHMYLCKYLQHTQHIRQCGLVFRHRREEDEEVVCGSIREQLEVVWGVLQWKGICMDCVGVGMGGRSGPACGMANSTYLAYYKSDSHSTQSD